MDIDDEDEQKKIEDSKAEFEPLTFFRYDIPNIIWETGPGPVGQAPRGWEEGPGHVGSAPCTRDGCQGRAQWARPHV